MADMEDIKKSLQAIKEKESQLSVLLKTELAQERTKKNIDYCFNDLMKATNALTEQANLIEKKLETMSQLAIKKIDMTRETYQTELAEQIKQVKTDSHELIISYNENVGRFKEILEELTKNEVNRQKKLSTQLENKAATSAKTIREQYSSEYKKLAGEAEENQKQINTITKDLLNSYRFTNFILSPSGFSSVMLFLSSFIITAFYSFVTISPIVTFHRQTESNLFFAPCFYLVMSLVGFALFGYGKTEHPNRREWPHYLLMTVGLIFFIVAPILSIQEAYSY